MKLELSHDMIAGKIARKISSEDKQIRKMQIFIRERLAIYRERKTALLEKEDIEYILPFLSKLVLNSEEINFINASIKRTRFLKILKAAAGIISVILILSIGSTAFVLGIRSEGYRELLIEQEKILKEKTLEIEEKSVLLKDKLKEEEELDRRLDKIQSVLAKIKEGVSETDKLIAEKRELVSETDSVLRRDAETRLESFRQEMAKPVYWTDPAGESDWESARKKCISTGGRLPNRLEWESVFLKNKDLIQKWKSVKCCKYWTIHSDSQDKATSFDITAGNTEILFKDNSLPIICAK